MVTRHLTLGVVQMDSQVGQISANLEHAGELVRGAARQGAQLVIAPELMPCGYTLTEAIWGFAESFDGQTTAWLAKLARQLQLYLGTTFLEVCGEDFYNTFALAGPDGSILGRVRNNAASFVVDAACRRAAILLAIHGGTRWSLSPTVNSTAGYAVPALTAWYGSIAAIQR